MSTEADQIPAQSLSGRNIIITRARSQAADFIAALEIFGARVIPCPTIEITEPESFTALDEAIDHLFGYDWIIFTSSNGVEHFLNRLKVRHHDVSELDDLRVCAIGDATAEKIRAAQVHVDVIPDEFKAEGVLAALERFVGGRPALAGLSFLIPRAAIGRSYLPEALEEAGARADVVPAYRTVQPKNADLGRIKALLSSGSIDCIAFTSSSTVTNFAQLFDAGDLADLLKGVVVACIGDITSKTASEHGLRPDIIPTPSTVPALAKAIATHFAGR